MPKSSKWKLVEIMPSESIGYTSRAAAGAAAGAGVPTTLALLTYVIHLGSQALSQSAIS